MCSGGPTSPDADATIQLWSSGLGFPTVRCQVDEGSVRVGD